MRGAKVLQSCGLLLCDGEGCLAGFDALSVLHLDFDYVLSAGGVFGHGDWFGEVGAACGGDFEWGFADFLAVFDEADGAFGGLAGGSDGEVGAFDVDGRAGFHGGRRGLEFFDRDSGFGGDGLSARYHVGFGLLTVHSIDFAGLADGVTSESADGGTDEGTFDAVTGLVSDDGTRACAEGSAESGGLSGGFTTGCD